MKNKEPEIKELKNYTVKVEAFVPTTYTYTIKAYSPEEAADPKNFLKLTPTTKQVFQIKQKIKKITVFRYGQSIIEFIKNLL